LLILPKHNEGTRVSGSIKNPKKDMRWLKRKGGGADDHKASRLVKMGLRGEGMEAREGNGKRGSSGSCRFVQSKFVCGRRRLLETEKTKRRRGEEKPHKD